MSEETFLGSTKDEVLNVLTYMDWNWHLAADYFGCDAKQLQSNFQQFQPKTQESPKNFMPFESSHISTEDIKLLKNYVEENLSGSLPLLFDQKLTEERKRQIAEGILLEKGLYYKLTHSEKFIETYDILIDEALVLEKWREQSTYLTIIEEALFKISAKLSQEAKTSQNPK